MISLGINPCLAELALFLLLTSHPELAVFVPNRSNLNILRTLRVCRTDKTSIKLPNLRTNFPEAIGLAPEKEKELLPLLVLVDGAA